MDHCTPSPPSAGLPSHLSLNHMPGHGIPFVFAQGKERLAEERRKEEAGSRLIIKVG